jgi:hypothetical protein
VSVTCCGVALWLIATGGGGLCVRVCVCVCSLDLPVVINNQYTYCSSCVDYVLIEYYIPRTLAPISILVIQINKCNSNNKC